MNAAVIIILGFGLGAGVLGYALVRARKRRLATFESEPERALSPQEDSGEDSPVEEPVPSLPETPISEPAVGEAVPAAKEAAKVEPKEQRAPDMKVRQGLSRSRGFLMGRLSEIFGSGTDLKEEMLESLEEALLSADVGVRLAMEFCDHLRGDIKAKKITDVEGIKSALANHLENCFVESNRDVFAQGVGSPKVILFVGVNGVGKTTTIGKIAAKLAAQEKDIVLAAGDTFRAAAAEQLGIWSERTGAKLIRGDAGGDPASVIFNALTHAKQSETDFVLADTAGRLHTKTELMDELAKIQRVAGKACEGAPDEVWLVVDATMGQNALQQAKEFHEALGLTGVVLTKLDGTARGGIVVAIAHTLKLPILYLGVGEQAEDLRPFVAQDFVSGLLAEAN